MAKKHRHFANRRGNYIFEPRTWRDRKGHRPEFIPEGSMQRPRKDAPRCLGERFCRQYDNAREKLIVGYQLTIVRRKPKIPRRVLGYAQDEQLWRDEAWSSTT